MSACHVDQITPSGHSQRGIHAVGGQVLSLGISQGTIVIAVESQVQQGDFYSFTVRDREQVQLAVEDHAVSGECVRSLHRDARQPVRLILIARAYPSDAAENPPSRRFDMLDCRWVLILRGGQGQWVDRDISQNRLPVPDLHDVVDLHSRPSVGALCASVE